MAPRQGGSALGDGAIADAPSRRRHSSGNRQPDREATQHPTLREEVRGASMIARISRPIFSERGTALLFALTVTSLLFLPAHSLAILPRSSTIVEVGHADTTQSFYYAEAGVNRGLAEFKNIFQGYNFPSGPEFDPRNFTLNGTAVRYQLSAVAGYPQFVRIP